MIFALLFSFFLVVLAKDGMECGICEMVVSELDKLESKEPEEVIAALDKICELFSKHKTFEGKCETFVAKFVAFAKIFDAIDPSTFCQMIGICEQCVMYPYSSEETPSNEEKAGRLEAIILATFAYFFMKDDSKVSNVFVDLDGDGFDELTSDFRGRDCDDSNPDIRPTVKESGIDIDKNCNGIYGFYDESQTQSYEDVFCNDLGNDDMNFLTFGDSVCVGFSIEQQWLDLDNLVEFAEKALTSFFSFPERALTTGFQTNHSIYQELFKRNKCAHRQFQNLCVSGAEVVDLVDQVHSASFPEHIDDMKPSFVYLGYMGNDICKDTLEEMTTPETFRKQLVEGLQLLDTKIAPNSKVLLIGFANGMQYEIMANQTHPVSSPTHKVTYSEFYDFLSCSGLNVCGTWLTSDDQKREKTTKRAQELDEVIRTVATNMTFERFEMRYLDIDHVIRQGIDDLVADGFPKWYFFNAIDGFHPSIEYGHPYSARAFVRIMEEQYPGFLGSVNPHNEEIEKVFGDQGGY